MKHMNPKIERLLHEGFSIKTLENFNSKQIDLLYSKINEQIDMVVKKEDLKKPETASALEKLNPGTKITIETEVTEKALSKKQQQFFGIVRGMQKGDIPKKGKAGKVSKEIDPKDAEDFASTKHKGLPKKVDSKKDIKKLEENIMKLIEDHLPPHTTKGELLNVIRRNKR